MDIALGLHAKQERGEKTQIGFVPHQHEAGKGGVIRQLRKGVLAVHPAGEPWLIHGIGHPAPGRHDRRGLFGAEQGTGENETGGKSVVLEKTPDPLGLVDSFCREWTRGVADVGERGVRMPEKIEGHKELGHHHAAIDRQHLARDIRAAGAREKRHGGRDVLARAETSERNLAENGFFHILRQDIGHVGGDESGGDGVHRDAAGGGLAGDGFGEPDEAGLAGGVVGLSGIAHEPDNAAHIDDASGALLEHRAQEPLDEMECAVEIGVDDGVPIRGGHSHGQAVPGDAGVVDENVHPAEIFEDARAQRGDLRRIGDVGGVGEGGVGPDRVEFGGDAGGIGLGAAHDRDAGAAGGELQRDRAADAAPGPRDDGDLIFKRIGGRRRDVHGGKV